jgi:hypothetical protein
VPPRLVSDSSLHGTRRAPTAARRARRIHTAGEAARGSVTVANGHLALRSWPRNSEIASPAVALGLLLLQIVGLVPGGLRGGLVLLAGQLVAPQPARDAAGRQERLEMPDRRREPRQGYLVGNTAGHTGGGRARPGRATPGCKGDEPW